MGTTPQDNVPDLETSDAHTSRPVRSSAQKAREQVVSLGYDSDDSEELPVKTETAVAAKGKTGDAAGGKRKQSDDPDAYSASVNKMQKMSLDGDPWFAKKQTKISLPQAKMRALPVHPTSEFSVP